LHRYFAKICGKIDHFSAGAVSRTLATLATPDDPGLDSKRTKEDEEKDKR
jgi:hypothetical protein